MSVNSYLQNLRRALPSSQGQHILRLLIAKKNSGEIKTLDEFKTRLKELTTQILAEKLTPSLKIWKAVPGEDISSEQYNDMLDRIRDDLEAAFAEANNMEEIITAHHQLISRVALETMRLAVNELEGKVALYEFIQKNSNGFTDSQFNTFRTAVSTGASASDPNASQIFLDPRKGESVGATELAQVDVVGERLTLGFDSCTYVPIVKATHVTGTNSLKSELEVTFSNSDINHIIDGENNTYWAYPMLTSSLLSAGAKLQVELNLGGLKDINFLDIEPATYFPFELTGITYINGSHIETSVSLSTVTISRAIRIELPRITASSVILSFVQYGYEEVQFRDKVVEPVHTQNNTTASLENLGEELRSILGSQFLLDEIIQPSSNQASLLKYYEYVIGFDNIKVGYATFRERSVFAGKPRRIENLGLLGLRTTERRPTQTSSSSQVTVTDFAYPAYSVTEASKYYHGSVEYWALVKSYDVNGKVLASDYLPLLPLSAVRIYHERCIFTKKSTSTFVYENAGSLMFYTAASGSDVVVYRNGSALTYTTDWTFSVDSQLTQTDPDIGIMKRGIQLVADPNPLDIYTVSYTPTLSTSVTSPPYTTLFTRVSLASNQEIRLVPDNLIWFDCIRKTAKVAYSDVYLIIVMRRNSGLVNVSPAVEEYLFVSGDRNPNKLIKDY